MRIGILTLPGALLATEVIENCQVKRILVQKREQVESVDGLVLAGNNISLLGDILVKENLVEPILARAKKGMPLWGLGAGLFLMAKAAQDSSVFSLNLMDIIAIEEGLGKNLTIPLYIPAFGHESVIGYFDHAPGITKVEPHVGIMAYYRDQIVMARQGNLLVSAFFTSKEEKRLEQYFFSMVEEALE